MSIILERYSALFRSAKIYKKRDGSLIEKRTVPCDSDSKNESITA